MIDRAAVHHDGKYTYSHIVSLKFEGLAQIPVFIYPNPVSDVMFVENKQDIALLKIVNLQGKTVYEARDIPVDGLSVKKIAAGLYQVQINRKSGTVQTQRVIIP